MRNRLINWLGLCCFLCLCVGFGTTGLLVGCEEKPKDACTTNLDCDGDQACATSDKGIKECLAKGGLGDKCKPNELPCLQQDKDGRKLICDPTALECKNRCETNLDCDSNDQVCNTGTGICESKSGPTDGGPPTDTGPATGQKLGEDCGGGLKCESGLDCVLKPNQTDGKCWPACTKDLDCKDGRACAGGYCVTYGEQCLGQPGGSLTVPCYTGLECLFESAGGGSCYRVCQADTDCPNNLKCVDKGQKKFCVQAGDVAGPGQECGTVNGKQVGCTAGHQCIPERVGGQKKVCTKECASDAECSWPRFCNQVCTLGTVGTAELGKACETTAGAAEDKRCDGGLACLSLQQGGGLCYRSCKDPRADPCPTGTECVTAGTEKYCLKKCTAAADCQAPSPTCGQLQGTQGQYCLHGGN